MDIDLCIPKLFTHTPHTLSSAFLASLKSQEADAMTGSVLSAHSINSDLRAKMIDWMIEVTRAFGSPDRTFFLSVNLLDRFFEGCAHSLSPSDLLAVGAIAILIASKHEDVYPLTLQVVYEKVVHRKISLEQLQHCERVMLVTLKFDIERPVCIDFWACFSEDVNEDIRQSARVLLYMLQLYYDRKLLPSVEAAAALVVAAMCAGEDKTAKRVLEVAELLTEEMKLVVNKVYSAAAEYMTTLGNYTNVFKFVGTFRRSDN